MAALFDPQFEREMLMASAAPIERLSALGHLVQLATAATALADRDRKAVVTEIERMGVRIVAGERLLDRILSGAANPAEKAGILLNVVMSAPPLGAHAREFLLAALTLLAKQEARDAMARSPALKQRLKKLLAAA